jgi:acid phosphatase family membrane protein YuiD
VAANPTSGFNRNTLFSLPFILLVLTNVAAFLATTGGTVSSHNAWVFAALSAGVYALSRGLAKFNSDGKPFYLTTEFWVAVLGAVGAVVAASQGHISDTLMKELLAFIAAATVIAEGLRTPPSKAVGPGGP